MLARILILGAGLGVASCLPLGAALGLSAVSGLVGGTGRDNGIHFDQPYDDRAQRFAEAADQARAQSAKRVLPSCEQRAAELRDPADAASPAEPCGIRPICLPGASQPMMLMVCEEP